MGCKSQVKYRRTKKCTRVADQGVPDGRSLGGNRVNLDVRAMRPGRFFSSAALRRKKKQTRSMALVAASLGPAGMKPTGGQEELDRRCVSLPSGLPGGSVTCSYRACVRASHRISSYSYSAKRYSVKRYSYSMAVRTSAIPIVDRGDSWGLADQ